LRRTAAAVLALTMQMQMRLRPQPPRSQVLSKSQLLAPLLMLPLVQVPKQHP
jgi:hypothetical protein